MLRTIIFCFVTFELVATQLNGEFWWLNSKLAQLKHVEPPRPKFEDISEFDTDETAKVVFKDNDNLPDRGSTERHPDTSTEGNKPLEAIIIYFRDDSKLTSQFNTREPEKIEVQNNVIDTINEDNHDIKKSEEDLFNFIFPDDAAVIKHQAKINAANSTRQTDKKHVILDDKILFDTEKETLSSENICTYMKEIECNRCNGVPYNIEDKSKARKNSINSEDVCCILPLHKQKSSKISFINSYDRLKRSANEQDISLALKQRNALMQRRYGTQTTNIQAPTMSIISQKIVTPDNEHIDPYWNIKGYNLKRPDKQEPDYIPDNSHQVYDDYYAEELPKPGLIGLYSDHRPSGWSFTNAHKGFSYNNDDNSDEVTGYSTIDPRHGHSARPSKLKRRFLKQTTATSSEDIVHPETETVTYQSNPDFQVLQGFKLPILKPISKPRPMRNLRRTTTTELTPRRSTVKSHYESYIDRDYDDYIEIKQQIYKNCGRTKNEYSNNHNCDRELGESPEGEHPWLLLAVLTKSRHSILCYATLIHPLAAITAADCTYGIAPGEITIIAGTWDLEEDNRTQLQHRLASVYAHQQYLPGKIAYNIALLYWRRPLRLDANVQPACVSDGISDNECVFVGWGGYDQAIYQRPHWQRASILSPRDCDQRISTKQEFDLPIDAFCATVNSETTVAIKKLYNRIEIERTTYYVEPSKAIYVDSCDGCPPYCTIRLKTGLGGPLMCKSENTYSVTGFAIWRDEVIVLMRVQEWTIRAMGTLGIN